MTIEFEYVRIYTVNKTTTKNDCITNKVIQERNENMARDIRHYQNRIEVMEGRSGKENGNIIKKLKRKIRSLQKQEPK